MASNVRQLQRAGLLGLAPTLAKFLPSAAFTTAAARLADLQVAVPPLGESITDGAIAAITKGPGDPVEEDDTLLSIETDKVTVDVRSPVAGYVKSILVSTAETVEVGKVVAVITQGEARGTVDSTPETAVEERRETSSRSKAASAASVDERDLAAAKKNMERVFGNEADHIGALCANGLGNSNGHGGHRAHRAHRPSISFPTRRTADGRMISELPASDQARIRAEELSNVHSKSFFLRANAAINGGATRGSPVLHRAMSDREMELVMLGGAE